MGAPTPVINMQDWRFRADDGDETGASWLGAAHAQVDISADTNPKFRLRVLVQETDGDAYQNYEEYFFARVNSGTWFGISTSSSYIVGTTSANYSHGDNTTQQLGSGTFISTNYGMSENALPGSDAAPDFSGSDEVEFETCLQLVPGDLNNGDQIDLKVTDGGGEPDAYGNGYATLVVEKLAAAARRVFVVS